VSVSEQNGENVGMIWKYVFGVDWSCLDDGGDGGYCL
jgi:hypothetical protein